ncbi:hypothetical protein LTR78_009152 [Recurvomyces mirabilis]|uniref:Uncharacterized protein n=1 Tax=Recurvomyces mirabilis TaxID=574656 RepID=A0AAE0WGP0_9PEZI|nr:hypothetical protein LTR78_009152 [Recurvomyces mirabilis]KAK5161088.1 hypothetical protein LTS14_000884 [Recurvomyces mirabilis]
MTTNANMRALSYGSEQNGKRVRVSTSETELTRNIGLPALLSSARDREEPRRTRPDRSRPGRTKSTGKQKKTCSLDDRVYSAADEYKDIVEDIIDEPREKVDGLEDDLKCEQKTVGRHRVEVEALTAELEQQKFRLDAVVDAEKEVVRVADRSSILQLGHAMFKLEEALKKGS